MTPIFPEALDGPLRCRRRFFLQKNDPRISGSPGRPPTWPQALFQKNDPHIFGGPPRKIANILILVCAFWSKIYARPLPRVYAIFLFAIEYSAKAQHTTTGARAPGVAPHPIEIRFASRKQGSRREGTFRVPDKASKLVATHVLGCKGPAV